jgi:hypothetical protein
MKRTIIFGSIFTCFILLIIPNINASQYQLTKDDFEDRVEEINPFSKLLNENDIDTIDEVLIDIIVKILETNINRVYYVMDFIISGGLDGYDKNAIAIVSSMVLSSYFGLFMAEGFLYNFVNDFIEKTDNYPPLLEFFLTLIAIPSYTILTYFIWFFVAIFVFPFVVATMFSDWWWYDPMSS